MDVKTATYEGWRKLGRQVKKGQHSQMMNAEGRYLFTEDQTFPVGDHGLKGLSDDGWMPFGAFNSAQARIMSLQPNEAKKPEQFRVGYVYKTRAGELRMITAMREGWLIVAEWGKGYWVDMGRRHLDGRFYARDGLDDSHDLMPGSVRNPYGNVRMQDVVSQAFQIAASNERRGVSTEAVGYPDPSAKRDAEHMPEPVAGLTPFDPFKGFAMTKGAVKHDEYNPPEREFCPLERVMPMPGAWGK